MTVQELIDALHEAPLENQIAIQIDTIYSEVSEGLLVRIMDADNDLEIAQIKGWM